MLCWRGEFGVAVASQAVAPRSRPCDSFRAASGVNHHADAGRGQHRLRALAGTPLSRRAPIGADRSGFGAVSSAVAYLVETSALVDASLRGSLELRAF